jgi:hypothetical protein
MNTNMKTVAITVLGATFGFGFTASADLMIGDTVELTFHDVTPRRSVDITYNGTSMTTRAGVFNWSDDVKTFCVQLSESIHYDQTVLYDIVAAADTPNGGGNDGTMGVARATLLNDLYSRYFNQNEENGWTARKAAAFQIAVWEITHETSEGRTAADVLTDLHLDSGDATFDSNNNVNSTASDMLDSLGSGGSFLSDYTLVVLANDGVQDHITIGSANPQAVPGTLGLASAIGLLGLKRRRSRRA